jgi:hypothetical protein
MPTRTDVQGDGGATTCQVIAAAAAWRDRAAMSIETDTDTDTPTLTAVVDTYLAAWNERDPARRALLVAQAWEPGGQLADPPMTAAGHDEIAATAAALHAQFPDPRFVRTSGIDGHHGFIRFAWDLVGPGGSVALAGTDVGVVGADGRLARIVGFFGELPPRET